MPLNHEFVSEPALAFSDCVDVGSIDTISAQFEQHYNDRLSTDTALTRGLVSFQANKTRSVYRWYKFKEAFSAELVEYLLERYGLKVGTVLDPFAGSGTALFVASGLGLAAEGIELLPIGQRIIETKQMIDDLVAADLEDLSRWAANPPWRKVGIGKPLLELRITKGAYSDETAQNIGKFLAAIDSENGRVRSILLFALLCILEEISFTRKDGQYLRWDYRSGRRQGKTVFNKGMIPSFDESMLTKLNEIVSDLTAGEPQQGLFTKQVKPGQISLRCGSCLDVLPTLQPSSYDGILTSPPYCNRYDYTRTYALELALLGVDEDRLRNFRQEMLSCTVENRAKDLLGLNPRWNVPVCAAERQGILKMVLAYLERQKKLGRLNNTGIPRMVKGYFYEMACVIFECARVLKNGAPLIMVNDNVRYAGASIPVDVILSEIACELGFVIESILVLPKGKGNSSQQMGTHGRESLRKCVYVWRRT